MQISMRGFSSHFIRVGIAILTTLFLNCLLVLEPVYSADMLADSVDLRPFGLSKGEEVPVTYKPNILAIKPEPVLPKVAKDVGEVELRPGDVTIEVQAEAINRHNQDIYLVAPAAGKIDTTALTRNIDVVGYQEPSAAELRGISDFIEFINMFGGPEDGRALIADAWVNYSKMTFQPMLEKGRISKESFDNIQAQFFAAQQWLQVHPEYSDGDDESISVGEFYYTSQANLWPVIN